MFFNTKIPINQSDYRKMNAHYLRKYIGLKEIIMVAFLFVAGLVLGIWINNLFVLIMCGVTVVLMALAIIFYHVTSIMGYNAEFIKREAVRWEITFTEGEIVIDLFEKNGEQKYTEKRFYHSIDKAAILIDKVYIYFGSATMYYVRHQDFTEGNFAEFCEFLKNKLEPYQLKMKAKAPKKF